MLISEFWIPPSLDTLKLEVSVYVDLVSLIRIKGESLLSNEE
jgi:hypothetical protein